MARKKIKDEELMLRSWEDVDITLKEIAECEMEVEQIETSMNKQLHDVKLAAEMDAKPFKDRIAVLGVQIKEFVEANKYDLDGKTKTLNFGRTGFRLSTKLVLKKVEKVIENLKNYHMDDCLIVKESVNKDVLKKYDEDIILAVGGVLKKEDTFWYETERDKLKPNA